MARRGGAQGQIHGKRQVVGRHPRQSRSDDMSHSGRVDVSAKEESVERPDGERGGERIQNGPGAPEPLRLEEPLPEARPNVVQVATHYDRRAVMQAPKRGGFEEPGELELALRADETEVQIVNDDRAPRPAQPNTSPSLEHSASLLRAYGQVDVMQVEERPPRQNGVSVSTDLESVLGVKREVRHLELGREHFRLVVEVRARQIVGDFLKQGEVGVELSKHGDHPIQPVSSIDAADALVNVPGDDSDAHPSRHPT